MISIESRLLDAVRTRLREFGINSDMEFPSPDAGIDAIITLSREKQRQRYSAIAKEPMTLSSLTRTPLPTSPHPPLIIGDRISRRSAAAFRGAGVQFVDASGNAFISFGNVLVEVQGRAGPTGQILDLHQLTARRQQSTNLFSSRRSQVILVLLSWPELSAAKVREIAKAAGVSTGQAHDALTQLQQAGFLVPGSKRLERADELLEYWTAAYPTGLGHRLELAKYYGDPSRPIGGLAADQPFYLSGESAKGSGVARPATLTVYLDRLDPRLPVLNRWNSSADRQPNVFVRRKFWMSPHPQQETLTAEGRNAPWPLVYADLIAARDARLYEVAEEWRSRGARRGEV